jgi:periplasmic divalent cation tolerance protein
MKNKAIVVLSTCPDPETARGLAADLVENGLAACVNIVPGLTSVYRWEGRTEESPECLMFIKTTQESMARLRQRIVELHPYELPEIVAVPVVDGLPAYLDWVTGSVTG